MGRKLARFLFSTMTPFCFLAALGGTAMAQRGALEIHNAPNYAAAAIAIVPDYVGSDDTTVAAAPAGRLTFGKNQEIKLVATTLSSNLLGHEFLRLGPTINYRFGRKSVDDELVDLMNDIDGTFEVGATVGLDFRNDTNPRFRFGVFLEFLQDVGDGHGGAVITGTLQYWKPIGRVWDFGVRAGLTYGSDDYMNTYFGVGAADSARSGLPRFSAGDGLRDVTVTPALIFHLSEKWHVGGFARYQRILSDAADSPVVDQRGSPDQFWIGLGAAFSW